MRINKETKVNTVFGIKSNITLDRLIKAINQSSAIIEDNKEYLIEGYLTKRDEDYSRINEVIETRITDEFFSSNNPLCEVMSSLAENFNINQLTTISNEI